MHSAGRSLQTAVVAVVAALTLSVAACSSTDGDDPSEQAGAGASTAADEGTDEEADGGAAEVDDRATVLQPGEPGEPNATLDPDATIEAAPWNDADQDFLTDMVPHHAQALEMAKLARTRADDPEVRAIADRIGDAQGAEIVGMSGWLQERGLEVPTLEDVEHHMSMAMAGMLTPEQMDALAAADGARFDRLYLAGMIQHHRGAVQMAREQLRSGADILVTEMATDVLAGQTAEIQRMRDIQARIG